MKVTSFRKDAGIICGKDSHTSTGTTSNISTALQCTDLDQRMADSLPILHGCSSCEKSRSNGMFVFIISYLPSQFPKKGRK